VTDAHKNTKTDTAVHTASRLWQLQTSKSTFVSSLRITTHCDVRFFVPYKYSYLLTY